MAVIWEGSGGYGHVMDRQWRPWTGGGYGQVMDREWWL